MDLRLELSQDFDLINLIARHPSVMAGSRDDGSVAPDDVDMRAAPMHFLLATCNGEAAGFYGLQPHNSVMMEVHTCILPHARGRIAEELATLAIGLIFEKMSCQKLITMVPRCNRPAKLYALRAGFRQEGVITKSFLKGGVLHDQDLLGLSKGN